MKLNILKKTALRLSFLSIFLLGLTSCEQLGLTAPKMDSADAVQRVITTYKEHVDAANYKPIQVKWYEIDKLSNDLCYLNIDYVGKEDNKLYTQSFKIGGDNQNAGEMELSKFRTHVKFDFEKEKEVTLEDINAEIIIKQIENAKSQIPEEYRFKSLSDYEIQGDSRKQELKATFTIRVTMKGEGTTTQGRQIITNYYEFDFVGNPDGTATMKD